MPPIDPKLQEDLLSALARHSDRLRGLPNVEHVDIGFAIAGGWDTGELSLRVFVREKFPLRDLMPESIAPPSLDGIDVDVIESNRSLHGAVRDRRFDPVLGGIETANRKLHSGGTLGMIVKDGIDGSPLALSNYHVWVKHVGQQGDEIVQPRATSDECVIGTLARWDEDLDCAVAALNGARFLQMGAAVGIGRLTTGIAHPVLGMLVVKSSTVTGVTYGVIEGLSETEMTITPDPAHPSALNQISLPGDSGAVWLDPLTGDAVALHYAGESPGYPDRAWAKSFQAVAAALQITF